MAYPDMESLLWFAGHWWWFPGAWIGADSEFEWKNDRVYLLETDGSAVGASFSSARFRPIDAACAEHANFCSSSI